MNSERIIYEVAEGSTKHRSDYSRLSQTCSRRPCCTISIHSCRLCSLRQLSCARPGGRRGSLPSRCRRSAYAIRPATWCASCATLECQSLQGLALLSHRSRHPEPRRAAGRNCWTSGWRFICRPRRRGVVCQRVPAACEPHFGGANNPRRVFAVRTPETN